jgi:nicotinamide riboside kinase
LQNNFRKYNTYIISGPESCGKTTLFNALKIHKEFNFLQEQSRLYLDQNGLNYNFDDITQIAIRQITSEDKLAKPLICDNDLINLIIWSQEKYKKTDEPILKGVHSYDKSRLYLLCSPDIPWEPDPQRENPFDRERLFDLHISVLNKYNLDFEVISGPHQNRLETARKYLGLAF